MSIQRKVKRISRSLSLAAPARQSGGDGGNRPQTQNHRVGFGHVANLGRVEGFSQTRGATVGVQRGKGGPAGQCRVG